MKHIQLSRVSKRIILSHQHSLLAIWCWLLEDSTCQAGKRDEGTSLACGRLKDKGLPSSGNRNALVSRLTGKNLDGSAAEAPAVNRKVHASMLQGPPLAEADQGNQQQIVMKTAFILHSLAMLSILCSIICAHGQLLTKQQYTA